MDPGISLTANTWKETFRFVLPGAGAALGLYIFSLGVKKLLGYPYLFEGGHKISFTKWLGISPPHPVMGGHHGHEDHNAVRHEANGDHEADKHGGHH